MVRSGNIRHKKDARIISSSSTYDRGPIEFKSRISEKEGDIMNIAIRDVATIPPSTSIMGAAKTMITHGTRLLPITDAGTNRLVGMVSCLDIVDFLGGGMRHNLVANRYNGNLFAAINEKVREIMNSDVKSVTIHTSLKDALNIMYTTGVGGLPILDEEERVKAMLSERSFVKLVEGENTGKSVREWMSTNVKAVSPDISIKEVTKAMIRFGYRRLPIVKDDILLGIVTSYDIIRYLGSGEVFNKVDYGKIIESLNIPIKNLISRNVVWSRSNIDLGEAARLMIKENIGSLPLIDEGVLSGFLTERDFVRAMI
ncbi:MAG: CBS domain-containing protein [Methanosarcinales archaeon]